MPRLSFRKTANKPHHRNKGTVSVGLELCYLTSASLLCLTTVQDHQNIPHKSGCLTDSQLCQVDQNTGNVGVKGHLSPSADLYGQLIYPPFQTIRKNLQIVNKTRFISLYSHTALDTNVIK